MTLPVWIDTDMGFDDLAATITVAAAPGFTIAGISLVAGNAPLAAVTLNARRAAACFGWTAPLHAGRAKPILGPLVTASYVLGDTGMATTGRTLPDPLAPLSPVPAIQALAAALEEERLELLCLGPLTNLAVLLLARPDLAPRIGSITWMGGSAGRGNHTAAAEFNAAVDPEAIAVVLESGVPLRMVGLDACRQVEVTSEDVAALRALPGERQQILADHLDAYVRIRHPSGRMSLYDPVAAAALVDPACVSFVPARIEAELVGGHSRGMTVVETRVPQKAAANAQVATLVDAAAVRRLVLGALATA